MTELNSDGRLLEKLATETLESIPKTLQPVLNRYCTLIEEIVKSPPEPSDTTEAMKVAIMETSIELLLGAATVLTITGGPENQARFNRIVKTTCSMTPRDLAISTMDVITSMIDYQPNDKSRATGAEKES